MGGFILQKLALLILAIFTAPAFADCAMDGGRFITAGGSEKNTILVFFNGGIIRLEHEAWRPGNYGSRSIEQIDGTWVCNGKEISVVLYGKKYDAILKGIGVNPLGIDEDEQVLSFFESPDSSTQGDLLNGEVFYRDCLLE
jgi:hypothetical protein